MSPRLAAVLVALSVTFTAVAAAIVLAGPWLWLILAAMSGLAIAGWLWSGRGLETSSLMSPYLTVVPLFLLLESLRYAGGWTETVVSASYFALPEGHPSSDAVWFLMFVCAPVVVVSFGGYALLRGYPIGGLVAWWAAFWAIVEGLLQLVLGGRTGWSPLDLAGLLPAAGLVAAGVVLLQRLLAPKARALPPAKPLTDHQRRLWAALFLALAAVYGVTLYREAGLLPVGIIVGSMMGGMIGWWKTTSRHPADPARVLPLYLVMMALFFIHVGEELLTGFNSAIAEITGTPWPDDQFVLLIALGGPVIWFFAAWSVWMRQAIGNYILWFMLVGMILGEPAHLLALPVVAMLQSGSGYQYFSGMYTALFPMVPAILAVVELVGRTGRVEAAPAWAR